MNGSGNDERRPGRGGVTVEQLNNHAEGTASELSKDSASGCATLHVELYRNTARLRGARILPLLAQAGVTVRMYDRAEGCWTVPIQVVDDVLCVAEYAQRRFVTVSEVAE